MSHQVKVVHMTTAGTAASRLILNQCLFLRQQGYRVSFVFSPGEEVAELTALGFPVYAVPIARKISPLKDLVSICRLTKLLRTLKPVIVHTHTSKAGIAGRIAARLAGVPVVFHTAHGFPFHAGMPPATVKMYELLEKFCARLSTVVFSQSREDVDTAEKKGITSRTGGLIYLGNGILLDRFHPDLLQDREKDRLKEKLGIKPGEVVLITVARLNAVKGYRDLITAAGLLPNRGWKLLCVGEDEGEGAKIAALIQRLQLADRVQLLGKRKDVPALLAIADIYVLASYREGIPRSVIEAQAMGLPAVVTDVRGSREVVRHGETGLIVPPKDSKSLAEALRQLLQDPSLRQKLGQAGRAVVLQEFDEHRVFQRLLAVYQKYAASGLTTGGLR